MRSPIKLYSVARNTDAGSSHLHRLFALLMRLQYPLDEISEGQHPLLLPLVDLDHPSRSWSISGRCKRFAW